MGVTQVYRSSPSMSRSPTMDGNRMAQHVLDTVRVLVACSLVFLNAPVVPAREFGVVEDVYVGRHTISPFGGIGRYQNLLLRSEELDNASWVKTNVAANTANGITRPD